MRSGCSLPASVLLLLFSGLAVWGARHWKPSIICDNSSLSWFCGDFANVAGGLPGLGGGKKHARGPESDAGQGSGSKGAGIQKVADALPWPVAEKPHSWSNFRKGAYSIPAVAAPVAVAVVAKTVGTAFAWPVAKAPRKWNNFRKGAFSMPAVGTVAAVAVVSKTVAHGFPWPVAKKSRKWGNFRKGAYSVPASRKVMKAKPKTVAHGFPWPVAKKSRKWGNFRKGAYSVPASRKVMKAKPKTVAHGFPWPIAKAPRKWTNFRKVPKRKKIVTKKGRSKTIAHPFPWPIAKAPRKWTNFRAPPKRMSGVATGFPWPIAKAPRKWTNFRAPPKRKPAATGIAHAFPWPIAKAPRKWSNFRAAPVRRKASDCGAELNQVARDGVILFKTASAKLKDSSYDTLDHLAGVAKTCDRVNIVVEGHTDDRGSAGFNQKLSERRAQSVAAYLQGAGVSAGSLSAVGYGESRPAVPNTTRANLAKNRRIEFSVSGN